MTATRTCWQVFSAAGVASRWGGRWEAWLHPQEAISASKLRDASRRQAWILGRIAARQLLLERVCAPGVCPRQVQIISQRARHQGCAPQVFVDGVLQNWSLSLSHSPTWVAVALTVGGTVGIDVVDLATVRPDRLAKLLGDGPWRDGRSQLSTAVGWAVVEAAFKSLGGPQSFRPGRFHLQLAGSRVAWRYPGPDGPFLGQAHWWRHDQAIVAMAEQTPRRSHSDTPQRLAA